MKRDEFREAIEKMADDYAAQCFDSDCGAPEAIECCKGDYIRGAMDAFDYLNKISIKIFS